MSGDLRPDDDLVPLTTIRKSPEIEIALGYLQSHGIDAVLPEQYPEPRMPTRRILVPSSQWAEAQRLLAGTHSTVAPDARPDPIRPETFGWRQAKYLLALVGLLFFAGSIWGQLRAVLSFFFH